MNISQLIEENGQFEFIKWNHNIKHCVYFVCDQNGLIVYIGQTVNYYNRFSLHKRAPIFKGKTIYFFHGDKDLCLKLERELIKKIKPKYNVCFTGQPNKRKSDII